MTAFAAAAGALAGQAGAVFGWSPDAFWRATPAELAALVRVVGGGGGEAAPANGGLLRALMERYPDE